MGAAIWIIGGVCIFGAMICSALASGHLSEEGQRHRQEWADQGWPIFRSRGVKFEDHNSTGRRYLKMASAFGAGFLILVVVVLVGMA